MQRALNRILYDIAFGKFSKLFIEKLNKARCHEL